MRAAIRGARSRPGLVLGEARKVAAFVRRDLLVAWSYRLSFVSDVVSLAALVLIFHFIGLMVDPAALPAYGGTRVTYLEFAVVGLALGLFMQIALQHVAQAIRNEQLMGTLESVLLTPTAPATIQLGSVAFALVYAPLRTAVLLVAIALAFGLHLELSGIGPAAAVLVVFIPFVWGLGVASAATILTFRRGAGIVGGATLGLALLSGAYFPIELLPAWASELARANPVAVAIETMRDALLGGAGWSQALPAIALLVPVAGVSLALGLAAFRLALRRERRLGTLGLY